MAFVQRQLGMTLTVPGSSPIVLNAPGTDPNRQLRMSVHMDVKGGNDFSKAQIAIYGMTESQMAAISTYGQAPLINPAAAVTVMAGDAVGGMFTAFQGTVYNAWADYNQQPEVPFIIDANAGLDAAMTVVAPASIKGATNAADLLKSLAGQIGYAFENNSGVNVPLVNPYFRGSANDQIVAICKAARLQFSRDNKTLAIWPSGQSRAYGTAAAAVTLSYKDATEAGYPTFFAAGIYVGALYNPGFRQGVNVKIVSTLGPANGTWSIVTMAHDLQANVPGGKWESKLQLSKIGDVTLPA